MNQKQISFILEESYSYSRTGYCASNRRLSLIAFRNARGEKRRSKSCQTCTFIKKKEKIILF